MYAKINGTSVIKFPYSWDDLKSENNNTRYSGKKTLPEWYAITEEGLESSNEIVEVVLEDLPADTDLFIVSIEGRNDPTLIDGVWVSTIKTRNYTEEELAERALAGTAPVNNNDGTILMPDGTLEVDPDYVAPEPNNPPE
jgi:hypothetical protein